MGESGGREAQKCCWRTRVLQAEIKTIAKLRKRCKKKEIEAMLKEKYAKYREE